MSQLLLRQLSTGARASARVAQDSRAATSASARSQKRNVRVSASQGKKRKGRNASPTRLTPQQKLERDRRSRAKAEAWYPSKFLSGFVGSSFVNANGTYFGKGRINEKGGGALVWPSDTIYHVTMHHNELLERNNGFGFHVVIAPDFDMKLKGPEEAIIDEPELPFFYYYFDRHGKWLETTSKLANRGRTKTVVLTTHRDLTQANVLKHVPKKVMMIAQAFAAMQETFRK